MSPRSQPQDTPRRHHSKPAKTVSKPEQWLTECPLFSRLGPFSMRFRSPMGLRILATTAAFAGLSAVALAANPAEAATLIFTGGTDTIFGNSPSTFSFTADGITATFSNPANGAGNAVSRTVPIGFSTLPNGGTCLGGQRPTGTVCGNAATPGAELSAIKLTFNKEVILNSLAVTARTNTSDQSAINFAISTWVNGNTTRQFQFDAPLSGLRSAGTFQLTDYNEQFNSFIVPANSPITITSGMFGSIDYWLSSITVTENVPAPVPVVGGIAALGFARRLRSKVKLASK